MQRIVGAVLPARLRTGLDAPRMGPSAAQAAPTFSPAGQKRLDLARAHAPQLAKLGLTPEQFATMTDEQVGTHVSSHVQQQLVAHRDKIVEAQALLGPDWLGKLTGGLLGMALGAPQGVAVAVEHPARAAKGVGASFKETVTHPVRQLKEDPAAFLVNTVGGLSAGAGTVGRVGALGDALAGADASSFADAVAKLPSADRAAYDVLADPAKTVGGVDEHTVARIASPSPHMAALLEHAPELVTRREALMQAVERGHVTVHPVGPGRSVTNIVRDVLATKGGRAAVAALKTPRPKERTLTIPGASNDNAAAEALAARAGSPRVKPGSIPDVATVEKAPDVVVRRLGSKNALANAFQRLVLDKAAQGKINRGELSAPPARFHAGLLEQADRNTTSLAASVGRDLDAERQVYERLAQAPAQRIERFGKTRAARLIGAASRGRVDRGSLLFAGRRGRLSLVEQKLAQIASVPGFRDDLSAAARLHTTYHGVHAQEAHRAGDTEAYTWHAYQALLSKAAEKIAGKPRPAVQQAIKEARALIAERERLLPDEKLDEARQLHRLGGQALELEHGALGIETPLQHLERLQNEVKEHRGLADSKTGARLVSLRKLLGNVEESIAARGTHAHGPALDDLRDRLAEHVNRYGDLQDVFGTAGAQRAAEQGLELDEAGGRPVLRQGVAPPTSRTFVGEPGRAGITADVGTPHTVETAKARLAQIEGMREKAITRIYDTLKERIYGKEGFGTKELRAETKLRNELRSTGREKRKGRAREGGMPGRVNVPTLAQELRDLAEQHYEDALAKHADDPAVQNIKATEVEAEHLRRSLNVLSEQEMFAGPAEGAHAVVGPDILGPQRGGGPQLRIPGREPSLRVEEQSGAPDVATSLAAARAKLAELEAGSRGNVGLSAQASLLKTEIQKLVEHKTYGPNMQRLAELEATKTARGARILGIHRDIIAAGKIARDKGAFYLPTKQLHDVKRVVPEATAGRSEYGLSPGDLRTQSLSHAYKAALMRQGNFRFDATGLAADSYREAQKMAALRRGFEQMWSLSHETRNAAGGEYAVAIRATREVPLLLKKLLVRADMGQLVPHDRLLIEKLGQNAEELRRWFLPSPDEIDEGTNLTRDGAPVRWVDARVVSGMMRQQPRFVVRVRGKEVEPLAGLDIPNNLLRGGLLYTKPAYALNLLQAVGTNALQQGAFTPINLTHALRLGRDLGADDQAAIFSLMQEGLSRSLEPGTGPFTTSLHHAGEFWNVVVDRMPRAASWLHEARREGFVSPGQIHTLIHDERLRGKLTDITRRANREIIDYSMSPLEKATIKRALFFYPWLRGSTLWSLRFPVEHPVTAAVGGNLAQQGRAQHERDFGVTPSYTEPLIKVGASGTINPANLNNFETPYDIAHGVKALFHPRDPDAGTIFGELSPVLGALTTLLTGKTSLGHDVPSDESRVQGAISTLSDALPPLAFYQRLTAHDTTQDPARQHIYAGGLGTALGKYGIGGLYDTPTNFDALHAKGKSEQIAAAGPRGGLDIHYHDALTQLHQAIPELIHSGRLTAETAPRVVKLVQAAVGLEHARDVALLDYAQQAGKSTKDITPAERLAVELRILGSLPAGDPRRYPGAAAVLAKLDTEAGTYDGKPVTSKIVSSFWTARSETSSVLSAWKRYLVAANMKYAGGG